MSASPPSVPGGTPARTQRARGGVVVPHAPKWSQRLVGRLVRLLLKMVAATTRFELDPGATDLRRITGPVIFCLWHNRLALCMPAYDRFLRGQRPGTRGVAALVSASKDGAFLTGILHALGVEVVRGSSSRRGAQALLELSTKCQAGWDVTITPDGPRGPCYHVHEGIISLAQVTGLPVVAANLELSRKHLLKSWDRFQIPLPFGRCRVMFSEPLIMPRDATPEERASLRAQLESTMRRITTD